MRRTSPLRMFSLFSAIFGITVLYGSNLPGKVYEKVVHLSKEMFADKAEEERKRKEERRNRPRRKKKQKKK